MNMMGRKERCVFALCVGGNFSGFGTSLYPVLSSRLEGAGILDLDFWKMMACQNARNASRGPKALRKRCLNGHSWRRLLQAILRLAHNLPLRETRRLRIHFGHFDSWYQVALIWLKIINFFLY